MTITQERAISDVYTTLRAILETVGKSDEAVSVICSQSMALLMDNFEHVAKLHAHCNEVASGDA